MIGRRSHYGGQKGSENLRVFDDWSTDNDDLGPHNDDGTYCRRDGAHNSDGNHSHTDRWSESCPAPRDVEPPHDARPPDRPWAHRLREGYPEDVDHNRGKIL